MITIKHVKTLAGKVENYTIDSSHTDEIDAEGRLTLLPALIDPYVCFSCGKYEDWKSGAEAAIAGGITTVFDIPNSLTPCTNEEELQRKTQEIQSQLQAVEIPLRARLYLGTDHNDFEETGKLKSKIVGIKLDMDSGHEADHLDRIFQLAAQEDIVIAFDGKGAEATRKAIDLAEKYDSQLFVLHVTNKAELELIRDAKRNSLLVYAEATPHHLFLTEENCPSLPLHSKADQEALWDAIHDHTIDAIGSGHTPCPKGEMAQSLEEIPFGVPGVETLLPLLLNATHEGKISLEKIVELTHHNVEEIFRLEPNQDVVLVDLDKVQEINENTLKTKCHWSPFSGHRLQGWPACTILNGQIFSIS